MLTSVQEGKLERTKEIGNERERIQLNKEDLKDSIFEVKSLKMNGIDGEKNVKAPPVRPPRPSVILNSSDLPPPRPPRNSPQQTTSSPSFMTTSIPRTSSSNPLPISTTSNSAIKTIRPESISLEQRLSNFDHTQDFDLELGGNGEKQVKISRKAQALLGLGVSMNSSKKDGMMNVNFVAGRSSNGNSNEILDEREATGRSRRREDEKSNINSFRSSTLNSNSTPSTPEEKYSPSFDFRSSPTISNRSPSRPSSSVPSTPPIASLPSISRSSQSFNLPKSPSYHPTVSRSGSTFSSLSSISSPSPSFAEKAIPKEKRGSTFMGFTGLKNLGRKKSSASSTNSQSISMSRGSSHSSFGETGALGELEEEGEEDQFSDVENVDVIGNNIFEGEIYSEGDMEELEEEEGDEEKEDEAFFGDVGSVRVGSKAATLLGLGLSERVGSPESTGMDRNGSRIASSVGSITNGIEEEENLPVKFPAQKMDLDPYQLITNQLTRQSTQPSSFLRSKEWKSRYIVLSSYLPHSQTTISASSLHCFKSNNPLDKEIDRLELSPLSLVYLPGEDIAKSNVIKVTGFSPRERDVSGNIKKGLARKEEVWILAMENLEMLKIWMTEIKSVIHELGGIATSTPIPTNIARSSSYSSNISSGANGNRRESEPLDALNTESVTQVSTNSRSTTSLSMTSMNRIQGSSPLGFVDSSSSAYYSRPSNIITSTPISSPPLSTTRAVADSTNVNSSIPTRPPRPPRSPRSPTGDSISINTLNELKGSPKVDSSGVSIIGESLNEGEFENEDSVHPYRRPSLVSPIVSKSNSRFNGSNSTDRDPISPTSNHSRNSDLSTISTSSLLYTSPRSPISQTLPDTPPHSNLSRSTSLRVEDSLKGSNNGRTPSRASNHSNTSSTTRSIPPPSLPAPTSSLPPLPTTASMASSSPFTPVVPTNRASVKEVVERNSNSKFIVPPRREFIPASAPPPTSSLPPPPTIAAPTSALPPPLHSLPPPSLPPPSLPPPSLPLPSIPQSEFPRPPPRSSERKLKSNQKLKEGDIVSISP